MLVWVGTPKPLLAYAAEGGSTVAEAPGVVKKYKKNERKIT
jgi:hypothetical protein